MTNATPEQLLIMNAIKAQCEKNEFVKSSNSYYARDGDPSYDTNKSDYGLRFYFVDTIEKLKEAFVRYEGLRQVYVYKNKIAFVNTVPSGWEAFTMKLFGTTAIPFESISMRLIIKEGTHDKKTFEEYIEELSNLTLKEVALYDQRKISAKELADLPEKWENPTVDTSQYVQCALQAWEVNEKVYNQWKTDGGLCQKYDGKFYVA
jgi:hypothetical protein